MVEHRLIERMAAMMRRQYDSLTATSAADPRFVDDAADFIRSYADRCHHGKEEGILFRDLAGRKLAADHKRVMDELVAEHQFGRRTTARMVRALARYAEGELKAIVEVATCVRTLGEFYPGHIEKEDKHFFMPAMEYSTRAEQDAMLAEMSEFDRKLIHEHFAEVVTTWESRETAAD